MQYYIDEEEIRNNNKVIDSIIDNKIFNAFGNKIHQINHGMNKFAQYAMPL